MNLDALVTRLYRAARCLPDSGWQELLKNAACSLSAAQGPAALVSAIGLTDAVLVLARLDPALTRALRQDLRAALGSTASTESHAGL